MRKQVLHVETYSTLDDPLLRHNAGESRPDHARPYRENRILYDGREESKTRLAELLAERKRKGTPGQVPNHAVSFILSGPPRYADDDAWDDERIDEWADANHKWVRQTFPHCRIAIMALRGDEASPHIHLTMVPETSDGRLSWKAVRAEVTGATNHHEHSPDSASAEAS